MIGRGEAITVLMGLIKAASTVAYGEDELKTLKIGLESLQALGVREAELDTAAIMLAVLSKSPMVSDVEDDTTVTTRDGEHSEGNT